MNDWYLYVVECSDGSLYTGITTDINRRLHEHNNTKRGAKYTRSRRPVNLMCIIDNYPSRSMASKYERAFKKLSRRDKLRVINESQPKPKFKKGEIVRISSWFVDPRAKSRSAVGMIIDHSKEKRLTERGGLKQFFDKFTYKILISGKIVFVPEQGIGRMYEC